MLEGEEAIMKHAEQRSLRERRTHIRPFNIHAVRGRRRRQRRVSDAALSGRGVDSYPRGLLFVTVAILLLCALDAHNTLQILSLGGREINPLMDFLIQTDTRLFVAGKFALTSLGILLFVGYYHVSLWSLIKVGDILYALVLLYLLLIGYQALLLAG